MYLAKLSNVKEKPAIMLLNRKPKREQYSQKDAVIIGVNNHLKKFPFSEDERRSYLNNLNTITDLKFLNPGMLAVAYVVSRSITEEGQYLQQIRDYTPLLREYLKEPANPREVWEIVDVLSKVFLNKDVVENLERYQQNIIRYIELLVKEQCL